MVNYNISSYSNIRNYLKTACLFVFITLPIPSIIMILYPEIFSFIVVSDAFLISKLGIAITFISVGLLSFYLEKDFVFTSKKDYNKVFFKINIIQMIIAIIMALIEYRLLDYIIKENKNSIIIVIPAVFIPLILNLFLIDYTEKLIIKRYPDIYFPYDYYKKFPDKINERKNSKIDLECMCISCMPDGVKREFIANKYIKNYTYNEKIILQIKYIIKDIGSSLLGPLASLIVPLLLFIITKDEKEIIFLSIIILSLFIFLSPIIYKKSIIKKLTEKNNIENEYSNEIIKIAKENNVNIKGVYPIESLFGENVKYKYLKSGFDYQTQACYLPLKKKEGIIFLGHAYRKGDESLKGVIGHEIGHGLRQSINYDRSCDLITALFSILIFTFLAINNRFLLSIVAIICLGFLIRVIRMYIRRNLELSADKFASKIYDSDDFILFFEKLERYFYQRKDYDLAIKNLNFFSSHPSNIDRIKALKSLDN